MISRRRWRSTRRARQRGELRRRHPRRARAHPRQPVVPLSDRARSGWRPAGAHPPVSDVELASRLSFFLWSSIPDDRLLNLAASGRLREPGVLASEVRRMIADKRADALVSNFVGQWLQLRNLESKVRPDILAFPDFDDNIREAFRRETELLFAHILRENRSVLELLSADYTFVNERLARHYGIPGVYGIALPQGGGDRPEPARPARSRQHPVDDVGRDADVAGLPRQVHPQHVPEHAAAAAAAERADARGKRRPTRRSRRRSASSSRCTARARRARSAIASSIRPGSRSRNSIRWGSGATRCRTARRSTRAA